MKVFLLIVIRLKNIKAQLCVSTNSLNLEIKDVSCPALVRSLNVNCMSRSV